MSPGPVLLIEDDRDIRDSVVEALEDEGYAITCAIDGLDALAKLRTGAALPRLILLDLMMPRMDGLQFRQEMLKEPRWAAIPVVVITADAQAREKARSLAAAGVLQKPVKLHDLCAIVRRTLDGDDGDGA